MPYKVKGKCVYKKDTGEKVGCTDGPIEDYLAALHIHADESLDITEDDLKKEIISTLEEHAKDFVWGIKGPTRVANQYKLSFLKKIIEEELDKVLRNIKNES